MSVREDGTIVFITKYIFLKFPFNSELITMTGHCITQLGQFLFHIIGTCIIQGKLYSFTGCIHIPALCA